MQTQAFSGRVRVEDQDFELEFERLIVREDGAAFALVGFDTDGEFRCEGFAPRMRDGQLAPAAVVVRYRSFTGDYAATIRLPRLEAGRRCRIEGAWDQYGETWHFGGSLRPRAAAPR